MVNIVQNVATSECLIPSPATEDVQELHGREQDLDDLSDGEN